MNAMNLLWKNNGGHLQAIKNEINYNKLHTIREKILQL